MTSVRIFFVGGQIAYRALFNWISPWLYIPTMLGSPLFQILFFAYLGRFAGVEDDAFFVVGNAVQVCGMSCIYAMTMTIANERWFATLTPLLATPANRFALFMGRALPVIANAMVVSIFSLLVSGFLLGIDLPASTWPGIVVVIFVSTFSCTGLGLVCAAAGLRIREMAVTNNILFGLLLIFTGANVPIEQLPGWMQAISERVPLTHGIQAAREVAAGATLGDVSGLLASEAAVGLTYTVLGYALLLVMERESRKRASIQIA